METAAIILNYNTSEETLSCVASIKENAKEPVNIIVVDNGSSPGEKKRLSPLFQTENVTVILSESNTGYSRGMNAGIACALKKGCGIFYLINSDVLLKNDIFTIINSSIDDRTGIAAPAVFDTDGNYTQCALKRLDLKICIYSLPVLRRFFSKRLSSLRNIQYDNSRDFLYDGPVPGSCFAVTRKMLSDGVLFDSRMFLYFEEDVLSYIARSKGLLTFISSGAAVTHALGTATEKATEINTWAFYEASKLYVLKEYAKADPRILRILTAATAALLRAKAFFGLLPDDTDRLFLKETGRLFS